MATTIEQQVALDKALVPITKRLSIGRSNFRLPSDIQSKESTLQVVYDVLPGCPFFKAFLVTVDVPEIYMQEFWATVNVHHHSIRFKMDSKKNIVDLEAFRDMLHISPMCLTRKSSGLDSFRLSQAQILWGLYHKRNIDYAFLIWEDFVHQVEHKNQKKSNEMYYPRFTKVIIHHFMTKKPSILRRNKVKWHYVRDDILFLTIKVVSRHQNTQKYGAILPIELTNKDIRNTNAYKEYYACANGEAVPKPKASARRKRSGSDSSTTPPTAVASPRPITTVAAAPWLTAAAKGKQPAKAKSPSDPSEVRRTEAEQLKIVLRRSRQETHISQRGGSSTDEGTGSKPRIDELEDTESGGDDDEKSKNDEESDVEETREDESFDPIPRTPEDSEDDGNIEEDQGLRVTEEKRLIEEGEADELYRDVDINQGRGLQLSQDIEDSHVTLTQVQPDGQQESTSVSSQFVSSMLNPTSEAGMESIFMTASTLIASLQTPTPIMTPSTIATITTSSDAPIPPTTIPSETNQFAEAVSNIPSIVHQYMNQQMTKAVREAVQIQTDRLQDSIQRENDEFLCTIDENMKRIIKEQVKSQVKEQVSRILPRIKESVNAQLEAEILTRSSHSSRTSYAVVADLTEMELKKILIEKMEGNKEDMTMMMIKKGPFAGSDRGSKRRREGGEPESASTPSELATRSAGRSTSGTQSRHMSASESAFAEEPVQTTYQMDEPTHPVFKTGAEDQPIVQSSQHPECLTELEYHLEEVYKATTDQLDWINPEDEQYPHNLQQPLPLILDNRGRRVIPFAHFINNDLEYLWGGASSRKYTTSMTKTKAADYGHIKWIEDLVPRTMWIQEPISYDKHALWGVSHWGRKCQKFYGFAVNRESALDVYSKRRIIAVTDPKIVESHNYKYLDWISVRRDDDKIYKFKEGDFKRLRLQDIEDMLLLLVQGKLSNVTIEERFAFNVSLRMFKRSIAIQRRVEDLQLGVKSYQKRLNLTKPVTYRSDLKRREAYTAYSNPRGFIYQNKDKKNRLMRIDELHKFSDRTLNDVRNALDDRLKGIRMQYLPQTIWRKCDKDRAAAMIQAIDKMLKTRRIMRSLERFIGGRLYEGEFRMLQRTI
uniref:Uncharacterized protein n=1 Tax=Tanacetum cinerariifolium TaxID=118510 RepID=A0A699GW74_TANCI|nr:hypothetical protein [Tanacetum cinerariifolium]